MSKVDHPFPQFPKLRRPLPPEYQAIYAEHYKNNRRGATAVSSLSVRLEHWMHRKVAAVPGLRILELGAGTLNQLPWEKYYQSYDVVEPYRDLYLDSPEYAKIRAFYNDISEVPAANRYDKISSIAVFEHVEDLPGMIERASKLLTPDGTLVAGIPSQGEIGWKTGYSLSTGIEFKRKYGLRYSVLMDYEHINTAREVEAVLRYYFADVKVCCFGLSRSLSFYWFLECRHCKK